MDIYNLSFTSVFVALLCISYVDSIMFHMGSNQKKCIREEIHKDVLVTGEYEVAFMEGHKTDMKVQDSKGQILYKKEDTVSGKFSFTTDDYEVFEVCFITIGPEGKDREVFLKMKHGVEAKNYQDMGKAQKLKPMEVEMKKLEDIMQSIVHEFAYMKTREEDMRDTNESTYSRVLYFGVVSMVCVGGLAVWQVLYLRSFFKSKKLID